ncbi:uncharacterized protein isoform X2 [Rhodnius prolixus]|uniref:uncharacterized protein isoform X2 n=1 Tax=Rhodnius prolixus TaxID=13249 RepID=UPI003D18D65F
METPGDSGIRTSEDSVKSRNILRNRGKRAQRISRLKSFEDFSKRITNISELGDIKGTITLNPNLRKKSKYGRLEYRESIKPKSRLDWSWFTPTNILPLNLDMKFSKEFYQRDPISLLKSLPSHPKAQVDSGNYHEIVDEIFGHTNFLEFIISFIGNAKLHTNIQRWLEKETKRVRKKKLKAAPATVNVMKYIKDWKRAKSSQGWKMLKLADKKQRVPKAAEEVKEETAPADKESELPARADTLQIMDWLRKSIAKDVSRYSKDPSEEEQKLKEDAQQRLLEGVYDPNDLKYFQVDSYDLFKLGVKYLSKIAKTYAISEQNEDKKQDKPAETDSQIQKEDEEIESTVSISTSSSYGVLYYTHNVSTTNSTTTRTLTTTSEGDSNARSYVWEIIPTKFKDPDEVYEPLPLPKDEKDMKPTDLVEEIDVSQGFDACIEAEYTMGEPKERSVTWERLPSDGLPKAGIINDTCDLEEYALEENEGNDLGAFEKFFGDDFFLDGIFSSLNDEFDNNVRDRDHKEQAFDDKGMKVERLEHEADYTTEEEIVVKAPEKLPKKLEHRPSKVQVIPETEPLRETSERKYIGGYCWKYIDGSKMRQKSADRKCSCGQHVSCKHTSGPKVINPNYGSYYKRFAARKKMGKVNLEESAKGIKIRKQTIVADLLRIANTQGLTVSRTAMNFLRKWLNLPPNEKVNYEKIFVPAAAKTEVPAISMSETFFQYRGQKVHVPKELPKMRKERGEQTSFETLSRNLKMVTPPLFDITAPEGGQKGFTRAEPNPEVERPHASFIKEMPLAEAVKSSPGNKQTSFEAASKNVKMTTPPFGTTAPEGGQKAFTRGIVSEAGTEEQSKDKKMKAMDAKEAAVEKAPTESFRRNSENKSLMKLERYFLRLCEISDSEGESDESSRDQSENMQMMDTEFDQFADEVFDEEPRRKEQGTCTSTCTKHLAGGGMSLCNCGEVAGLDFLEKVKERPKNTTTVPGTTVIAPTGEMVVPDEGKNDFENKMAEGRVEKIEIKVSEKEAIKDEKLDKEEVKSPKESVEESKFPPWGRYPYNKIIYENPEVQKELLNFLQKIKDDNSPLSNYNIYIESGGKIRVPDNLKRDPDHLMKIIPSAKKIISRGTTPQWKADWLKFYHNRALSIDEVKYIFRQKDVLRKKLKEIIHLTEGCKPRQGYDCLGRAMEGIFPAITEGIKASGESAGGRKFGKEEFKYDKSGAKGKRRSGGRATASKRKSGERKAKKELVKYPKTDAKGVRKAGGGTTAGEIKAGGGKSAEERRAGRRKAGKEDVKHHKSGTKGGRRVGEGKLAGERKAAAGRRKAAGGDSPTVAPPAGAKDINKSEPSTATSEKNKQQQKTQISKPAPSLDHILFCKKLMDEKELPRISLPKASLIPNVCGQQFLTSRLPGMPQPTPKVHVERSRPNIAEMNKHNTDTEGRAKLMKSLNTHCVTVGVHHCKPKQKKTDEPYVEFNTNRPEDEDGTRLVYQDLTTILQIGGFDAESDSDLESNTSDSLITVLMGKDGGDEEVLREKYVKKGCHVPDKKNKKVDVKVEEDPNEPSTSSASKQVSKASALKGKKESNPSQPPPLKSKQGKSGAISKHGQNLQQLARPKFFETSKTNRKERELMLRSISGRKEDLFLKRGFTSSVKQKVIEGVNHTQRNVGKAAGSGSTTHREKLCSLPSFSRKKEKLYLKKCPDMSKLVSETRRPDSPFLRFDSARPEELDGVKVLYRDHRILAHPGRSLSKCNLNRVVGSRKIPGFSHEFGLEKRQGRNFNFTFRKRGFKVWHVDIEKPKSSRVQKITKRDASLKTLQRGNMATQEETDVTRGQSFAVSHNEKRNVPQKCWISNTNTNTLVSKQGSEIVFKGKEVSKERTNTLTVALDESEVEESKHQTRLQREQH